MADSLVGTIRRPRWRSPEEGNDYVIAELTDGHVIKGNLPERDFGIGMTYSFQGAWKLGREFRGHQQREFCFTAYAKQEPHTRSALVQYLAKYCPGIGPTLAGRIFDVFGQQSVTILRTKPALVAQQVHGIKESVALEAAEELRKNVKFEEVRIDLEQMFAGKGFSRKLAGLVIKRYGVTAARKIRQDPFCLLVAGFPSCGFARCDRLYLELGKRPGKLKRLMLFVWHQIREDREGHIWHSAQDLVARMKREVGLAADIDAFERSSGVNGEPAFHRRIVRAIQLGIRAEWLALREFAGKLWIAEHQAAVNELSIVRDIRRLMFVDELDDQDLPDDLPDDLDDDAGESDEEHNGEEDWGGVSLDSNPELPAVPGDAELSASEKARIGQETGICQFCHRVLTKPESKRRGYGPICAERHGLPWDGRDEADLMEEPALSWA